MVVICGDGGGDRIYNLMTSRGLARLSKQTAWETWPGCKPLTTLHTTTPHQSTHHTLHTTHHTSYHHTRPLTTHHAPLTTLHTTTPHQATDTGCTRSSPGQLCWLHCLLSWLTDCLTNSSTALLHEMIFFLYKCGGRRITFKGSYPNKATIIGQMQCGSSFSNNICLYNCQNPNLTSAQSQVTPNCSQVRYKFDHSPDWGVS